MKRSLVVVLMLALGCGGGTTTGDDGGLDLTTSLPDTGGGPADLTFLPDLLSDLKPVFPDIASSGDLAGADLAGSDDKDKACMDNAAAFCNLLYNCQRSLLTLQFGDTAQCTSRLFIVCRVAADAPGNTGGAAAIASCAEATKTLSCPDFFLNKTPTACAITGTFTDGSACFTSNQCAAGFCGPPPPVADMMPPPPSVCGVCQTLPKNGEACAGACASSLICWNGTCVAFRMPGQSCGSNTGPCGAGNQCFNSVCTAPLGVAATCDPLGKTTPSCDIANNVFCHSTTKKCAAASEASLGSACGTINGQVTVCKGGFCQNGVCAPFAADGAACGTAATQCQIPARCLNDICQIPDPASCM